MFPDAASCSIRDVAFREEIMSDAIRWLTIREAADRACCRTAAIQRAVRGGRLRSARGEHGELRFLEPWIEEWLTDQIVADDGDIRVAVDVVPSGLNEFSWR
jgi:hypothetical protein